MDDTGAPVSVGTLCEAHGLRYDPRLTQGCVLCRRSFAPSAPPPEQDSRSRALLLLGVVSLMLVASLVVMRRQSARREALMAESIAAQHLAAPAPSSGEQRTRIDAPLDAADARARGERLRQQLDKLEGRPPPAAPAPTNAPAASASEAEQDRKRHAALEGDRNARALQAARERLPITMYSTTWCGYCRKASAYMRQEGIAFVEHDIDTDERAKAVQRALNPSGGVPTIDIDGEIMVGWEPSHFESTRDRAAKKRARL